MTHGGKVGLVVWMTTRLAKMPVEVALVAASQLERRVPVCRGALAI